jgi:hypothetical protein
METQTFWNNREADLIDAATRKMSPVERLNALRSKLATLDTSAMRESGIDNNDTIKVLREQITGTEIALAGNGWTKEQTATRRAAWNARVKSGEFAAKPGKPTVVQVTAAEKAQGWTVADLKKFVAQWGLV